MHAEHVLRVRTPVERREEDFFDLGLGEANILIRRNAITESSNVHQGNRHDMAAAGEVLGDFFRCDEIEVLKADTDRRESLAQAGVGQFGGVDAGALPEIVATGPAHEVSESDVRFGGRLVLAGKPARHCGGGHAQSCGQSCLREFEVTE